MIQLAQNNYVIPFLLYNFPVHKDRTHSRTDLKPSINHFRSVEEALPKSRTAYNSLCPGGDITYRGETTVYHDWCNSAQCPH